MGPSAGLSISVHFLVRFKTSIYSWMLSCNYKESNGSDELVLVMVVVVELFTLVLLTRIDVRLH